MSKNYIGTSGWSYLHWKNNFYPEGLKSIDWLAYYSNEFPTVEINTTFYHTPREATIEKWHSTAPKDFLFAIKASRYITHLKRLKDCKESLQFFYKSIAAFKNKTGPILFQLPPSFKINIERLKGFIALLNDEYHYTFEFRHPSWFVDEVYALFSTHKIALCITDLGGHLSPEKITSDFTYLRLHGPKKAYQGSYGSIGLKSWKKKIETWNQTQLSVFCYFDNDEKGYAIQDAKTLKNIINGSTSQVG